MAKENEVKIFSMLYEVHYYYSFESEAMSNLTKEAYDECQVQGMKWVEPKGKSIEDFQSDFAIAKETEKQGFILIKDIHLENQTGKHLVDRFKFQRLK